MLLIYEMPKEVRKDVIILYIIISIMYLQIWLISSGAKKVMENNKNYYYNLVHKYPKNFPEKFENQIDLDIGRTYPGDEFFNEENIKKLKNILLAFTRRETSIGYCQGFNFIVGTILKITNDEVIIYIIFILD